MTTDLSGKYLLDLVETVLKGFWDGKYYFGLVFIPEIDSTVFEDFSLYAKTMIYINLDIFNNESF